MNEHLRTQRHQRRLLYSLSGFSGCFLQLWILCSSLGAQDDAASALARRLKTLRDQVARSVVSIDVVRDKDPEGRGGSGPSGAHRDYYNRPDGPCTGTIWSEDGWILTSSFNVSGEIRRITVRLSDGTRHDAKRFGYDAARDIALIKIDASALPVLRKANLDDARQGDFVAVVGRAPDFDVPTLNQGIISAMNRMKALCLQTDAELNYGNVGGPLVNLRGEVLGVTCHIKPRTDWGQSGGVGFACKHIEIEKVLADLKQNRSTERRHEPWLGVTPAEGAEGVEGVVIAHVAAEGPGEEGGLQEGDVIKELDGKPVKTWDDVSGVLQTKKVGDVVKLKIVRKNPKTKQDETKDVKVKLGENPE